jgi:hypothetical protein
MDASGGNPYANTLSRSVCALTTHLGSSAHAAMGLDSPNALISVLFERFRACVLSSAQRQLPGS